MAVVLPTFPAIPSTRYTVTLGGARFTVRLTWRDRPDEGGWYLDLWTAAGAAIALGRRLCPGMSPLPLEAHAEAPDGVLLVRGPDPYRRADLGSDLVLVFVPTDELPSAPAEETLLVVVA